MSNAEKYEGRHQGKVDDDVINVKLMVDKTRNRVVFAEADHKMLDILISFLTLPLGTILKLLGDDIVHMTGSISRIYSIVSSLEEDHLRSPKCKTMLLSPKNAAEVHCKKLKININLFPELAGKFYVCGSSCHWRREAPMFSIYPYMRCERCGSYMTQEIIVNENSRSTNGSKDGVFVKGGASTFIVSDDLQILPPSTATLIALFEKLGIDDGIELEARTVEVRSNEVLQLLKFSLLSESTFTNAFLLKQGSWEIDTVKFKSKKAAKSEKADMAQNSNMTLKLLFSKSKKKVVYGEAGVDVVDFLFSFLTFPLGAVIKLLAKSSGLGCIDNLYKGVQDLSTGNYMKSEECEALLVSPKLAPHFSYENHPLQMNEYQQFVIDSGKLRFATDVSEKTGCSAVFIDTKSPTGETNSGNGYLKEPATFMITDDLVVTPLSPISSIALLNQMNVSITDVEERFVTLGKEEALNLLRASLISRFVLNDVFSWSGTYPKVKSYV